MWAKIRFFFQSALNSFLIWRFRHISQRNFLLIIAGVVGLCTGFAAVCLKNLVHVVGNIVTKGGQVDHGNFWYLILPVVGILLTVFFVKKFLKDDIGHGITKVLYAISRGQGILSRSKMYSSVVGSALTVGFGGSVGLEAPVVLTGSAIGSNIGRAMRLDYRSLVLMIGCGATGAVAAIFKAPIAGVIFTLEVLMIDLTMASVIPLLISAATAAALSAFLLGKSVLFTFDINTDYELRNIPYYMILGLFTGLVSLYFTKMNFRIELLFKRYKKFWPRAIVGGSLLSILIFFFPPLFGEGFMFLTDIIQGRGDTIVNNSLFYSYQHLPWFFLGFLVLILFLKVVAMSITTGSGGVGGVFAPSLFMGGVSGFFMARLFQTAFHIHLPESNFALAGMAGVMAGVMHAPLTAIFLIAEITGGYKLFIPLMITATLAYILNRYFQPTSIYTKPLADNGDLITHHKDRAALQMMNIDDYIETNFVTVPQNGTLRDVINAITLSSRNVFPIIDENHHYLGVVFLDDIRHLIFKPELYDQTPISAISQRPAVDIQMGENMLSVAKKFRTTEHYNIVVMDGRRYVGFVSRANIFSAYRKLLRSISEE